jgi:hypothetical protein
MASKPFSNTNHFFRAVTPFTLTDDSGLSEPPSDLDDHDFDLGANFSNMAIKSPPSAKNINRSPSSRTIKTPPSAKTIRMGNEQSAPSSMKRQRPVYADEDSDGSASHTESSDDDIRDSRLPMRKRVKFCRTHCSPLELIPNEVSTYHQYLESLSPPSDILTDSQQNRFLRER